MSCKPNEPMSTHHACDCILGQLQLADALAKMVRHCGHKPGKLGTESCCSMCDAREAYESARVIF